ncbi:MAG TPA: ATP-binding cassette domain-containing protein [Acidimicrobiales bacterium]|nr:ATP-binding cassette domain-containing protein [Acidimicrobiales bacterium]
MTTDLTIVGETRRAAGPAGTPRLACRDVTVRFGGVRAVDGVDLDVPAGAIVGLVGPNGAGKSTLFGVVSGLLRPTSGQVLLDGEDVTRSRPQRRAERGLARTFQHPELFGGLTVREHLVLAHRAKHARRRVWSDLFTLGSLHRTDPRERSHVDELLELLDLSDIAQRPAVGLPLGMARLLELARALATSPTVLLLDEPSSGLDTSDTARLETTLRKVAAERGISVLLVEHDVELVMRLCSTVNVLDFGQLIASGTPAAVRADEAVRAAYLGKSPPSDEPGMPAGEPAGEEKNANAGPVTASPTSSGAPASGGSLSTAGQSSQGSPLLRVRDLCVRYGGASALSGVSFELAAGETLAVLGANGAGKSSLARALSGLVRPAGGTIELDGEDVCRWPVHRIRRAGVIHLPEGRGVFRTLSVTDNLKMAAAALPAGQARRQAVELAFGIFPALGRLRRQPAGLLSGGEQQMLSLARALATSPTLLVADEMSLGLAPILVDLVFDGLVRAREAGVTVVMVEQYVHRALSFADRCLVLQRGEIAWAGRAAVAKDEVLRHYLGEGLITAS